MPYTPTPVPYYGPSPFANPVGTYPVSLNTPQIAYPNTQPPRSIMTGRVVSNDSEVSPSEVPMDGSAAFFPMSDGSKIFAKSWDGNGNIKTVTYIPSVESDDIIQNGSEVSTITMEDLFNMINDVNDNVKALTNKQNRYNKQHKQNNYQNKDDNSVKDDENA